MRPGHQSQDFNVFQNLLSLIQSFAVRLQINCIVKQQVVPFGSARLQHLDGGLLRESDGWCIRINDTIDDPTHLEEVVDRQENHRGQNQPHKSQAVSCSPAQRVTGRNNLERLLNFCSDDLSHAETNVGGGFESDLRWPQPSFSAPMP
jgi:hypothetical protein